MDWLKLASEFRFVYPVPLSRRREIITIKSRGWDDENLPIRWSVCRGDFVLDKEVLHFVLESQPSSRTEDHYQLTRYASKEEAFLYLQYFLEVHPEWWHHKFADEETVKSFLVKKRVSQ